MFKNKYSSQNIEALLSMTYLENMDGPIHQLNHKMAKVVISQSDVQVMKLMMKADLVCEATTLIHFDLILLCSNTHWNCSFVVTCKVVGVIVVGIDYHKALVS